MDKRYQVFVSSTFEDLKKERKAVIEELLNAGYIPAGMELFSASDDEQFEYIKKIIDNCDYYVIIIGARYGTINKSVGKSFTEQEFDYAVEKGIPILAFLHGDPYNLPAEKREDKKRKLLENFRKKVLTGRVCKNWYTLTELVTSVIISLSHEVNNNPQRGWTRGALNNESSQINDEQIRNFQTLVESVRESYKKEDVSTRKIKLDGKLEIFDNGAKYIKAFLPEIYQMPSFELYLEIEIIKYSDNDWAYNANLVRSGEIFKCPSFPFTMGEIVAKEEYVVNYVLTQIENEEIDWAREIQIYDEFVDYAMKYYNRVYNIERK